MNKYSERGSNKRAALCRTNEVLQGDRECRDADGLILGSEVDKEDDLDDRVVHNLSSMVAGRESLK